MTVNLCVCAFALALPPFSRYLEPNTEFYCGTAPFFFPFLLVKSSDLWVSPAFICLYVTNVTGLVSFRELRIGSGSVHIHGLKQSCFIQNWLIGSDKLRK